MIGVSVLSKLSSSTIAGVMRLGLVLLVLCLRGVGDS